MVPEIPTNISDAIASVMDNSGHKIRVLWADDQWAEEIVSFLRTGFLDISNEDFRLAKFDLDGNIAQSIRLINKNSPFVLIVLKYLEDAVRCAETYAFDVIFSDWKFKPVGRRTNFQKGEGQIQNLDGFLVVLAGFLSSIQKDRKPALVLNTAYEAQIRGSFDGNVLVNLIGQEHGDEQIRFVNTDSAIKNEALDSTEYAKLISPVFQKAYEQAALRILRTRSTQGQRQQIVLKTENILNEIETLLQDHKDNLVKFITNDVALPRATKELATRTISNIERLCGLKVANLSVSNLYPNLHWLTNHFEARPVGRVYLQNVKRKLNGEIKETISNSHETLPACLDELKRSCRQVLEDVRLADSTMGIPENFFTKGYEREEESAFVELTRRPGFWKELDRDSTNVLKEFTDVNNKDLKPPSKRFSNQSTKISLQDRLRNRLINRRLLFATNNLLKKNWLGTAVILRFNIPPEVYSAIQDGLLELLGIAIVTNDYYWNLNESQRKEFRRKFPRQFNSANALGREVATWAHQAGKQNRTPSAFDRTGSLQLRIKSNPQQVRLIGMFYQQVNIGTTSSTIEYSLQSDSVRLSVSLTGLSDLKVHIGRSNLKVENFSESDRDKSLSPRDRAWLSSALKRFAKKGKQLSEMFEEVELSKNAFDRLIEQIKPGKKQSPEEDNDNDSPLLAR